MAIEWNRKGADIVYYDGSMPGKGQIIKGVFNATIAGYALSLNTSRTWIERGNADDGGAILSGSGAAYLFGSRRLLLTAAQTGNNSFYGGSDRLSVNANVSAVTAHIAGHWGFLEIKSGANVNRAGAVRGQVDLNGATITGVVSAFMAATNTLAGTHTGPAVIVDVTRPVTGTWDALLNVDSLSGTVTTCSTALSGVTAIRKLGVYEDGVLVGYIPVASF